MKIIRILAAWLLLCGPVLAQAQLGAGQVWGNSTAGRAPGKSETVTAILDRALGSTRGAILERGAASWGIIGPSATVGTAWVSAGAGADPGYGVVGLSGGGCNAVLTASNGGILYSTASACAILAGTATARLPLLSGANTTPVWGAYTLPASVTSGGVACFTSTTVQASSVALSANAIVLGGGAGACPSPMASLGTTTTVLHGNAAGAPTFGSVVSADMNITATNCTSQFVSAISIGGVGTCGSVPISTAVSGLGTGVATALGVAANASGGVIALAPTRAGDIVYWNGSAYVTLPGNNSGTNILQETAAGVPSWVANAGFTAATKSDQQTGTSNVVAITPLHQQDHDSAAKAWCSFTAATAGTNACAGGSYNVTSVTKASAGTFAVNFTTAFASTSYVCQITPQSTTTSGFIGTINSKATGVLNLFTLNATSAATDPTGNVDVVCFGRQ